MSDVSDKLEQFYGEIFRQLVEMPHFCRYLDTHFDIVVGLNDETNYVEVTVQPLSVEETAKRTADLIREEENNGPKIIVPDNSIVS